MFFALADVGQGLKFKDMNGSKMSNLKPVFYIFKNATDQFDTGLPLDEVMMSYITEVLNGIIGEKYAEPQGRIIIK